MYAGMFECFSSVDMGIGPDWNAAEEGEGLWTVCAA